MKKVIGLTGTIGAGKDIVKEFLLARFNCYYVSLSSIIRTETEKKNPSFNRRTLQDLGNELRKRYGNEILAKLAVEYLQSDKELIVVDGIRNPGEIEFLRKKYGEKFALIGVDAPPKLRFERLAKRGSERDPKTWEEFLEMDERDQGIGEPEYGQQTKKCLEQSDFLVFNEGTKEEMEKEISEIIQKI